MNKTLKGIIGGTPDGLSFPAKRDLRSGALFTGEKPQLLYGDLIFFQQTEHLVPDGARSAENGKL